MELIAIQMMAPLVKQEVVLWDRLVTQKLHMAVLGVLME
jgi:hypothetical protein